MIKNDFSNVLRFAFIAAVLVFAFSSVTSAQTTVSIWPVKVLLNGKPLLSGHAHVDPAQESVGVDETCISFRDVERLVGGPKYLLRKGNNLNAVVVGSGDRAVLRVQRLGPISTHVHKMGSELYIPLGDLMRALGASSDIRGGTAHLVLKKPYKSSILTTVK
jgi:hypothetical protein